MRAHVSTLAVALALVAAPHLAAADGGVLGGKVNLTRRGARVADASGVVVYLVGFDEKPPRTAGKITQKGRRFVPDLLAVTVGQSIDFPNADPHLHNVFSPSATRPFDLGSFKKGQSKSKEFPRTGVVDVYCNIHPEMSATILVVPNQKFARAAADGSFRIADVPAGTWTAYAYSRGVERPVAAKVTIAAGQTTTVTLALDETKTDLSHKNKYGETYREPGRYR